MARTLGQVREIILKTPHGAGQDLLLLTERINGRYQEILNMHPWSRLRTQGTLTTVADYDTGTVAIDNGLMAVTLTDGTFPTALSGGRIRIGTEPSWYVFTRTGATTGTIERAFEGDTVTDAAYQLWQPIYSLPSDCDNVLSISVPSQRWELDKKSPEWIDEQDAAREQIDFPMVWADYSDASSLSRIELWPGPTEAEGLPLSYTTAGTMFDSVTDAAVAFPDWVDTDAIIAGVEADILSDMGSPMAAVKEAKFAAKVAAMFSEDCQRRAPIHLAMSDRYVAHRVARELDDDRVDRRAALITGFR